MKTEGLLTDEWTEFTGPITLELVNSHRFPVEVIHRSEEGTMRKSMKKFSMARLFVDAGKFKMRCPMKTVSYQVVKS